MNYEAIVIGAGGMGSAAAYHLAKAGYRTLLLEQFTLDHRLGSSYGYSRIIRHAYTNPIYVEMINAVFPLWRTLEAEAGENLLIQTGSLNFGRADFPALVAVQAALAGVGIPFETLSPAAAMRRFPQFHLDDDMLALYEAQAGLLKASACVRAQVRLAQQHGATMRENCAVKKIIPAANGVSIQTDDAIFNADKLIITAGAWSPLIWRDLGLALPLTVTREQLVFFDAQPVADYTAPHIPVSICWGDTTYYTIGSIDGTGFKVARHLSHQTTTADTVNRTPDDAYVQDMRGYLRRHMPAIAESRLLESRVCLYTMTPNEDFILDTHPAYPHIALGGGFSGHGFKFSNLIGKILADKVCAKPVSLDLRLFRI